MNRRGFIGTIALLIGSIFVPWHKRDYRKEFCDYHYKQGDMVLSTKMKRGYIPTVEVHNGLYSYGKIVVDPTYTFGDIGYGIAARGNRKIVVIFEHGTL